MRILTRASAGLAVALVFSFLSPPAAIACQECFAHFDDEWCHSVPQGETGYTICFSPEEASCCCSVGGDFCTDITVDGGGSGGGTGGSGGSNPCYTTGFCPAECFSCGGGGGRPPVV